MIARNGFIAIALAALVAGCGSSQAARDRHDACIANAQNRAEAKVVERLFSSGKLGSAAQVRAESSKAHPFVDAKGHMLPYARMSDWQRAAFNDWKSKPRVQRIARERLQSADAGAGGSC